MQSQTCSIAQLHSFLTTLVPRNQTLQNVLNIWFDTRSRWYPVHGLDHYRESTEFLSVLCKCLAFSDLRYFMQIDVICEDSLTDESKDEFQSNILSFLYSTRNYFLITFFLYLFFWNISF